ncbi:MAG: class I SAM-dependent methyltransferase [Chloroflexi bacterium]|nr:class I SAM-dependent methyltransferase [Chloroflexota bacterium]
MDSHLYTFLDQALALRQDQASASRQMLGGDNHVEAFRLFNGFYEGYPSLVVDVYARTLVIHDYSETPDPSLAHQVFDFIAPRLPWLGAAIVKARNSSAQEEKRGKLLLGGQPDRKIREHGVWYAIDLLINRDASFYLDTSNLRKWLLENSRGKSVLNTFAYTGSLGVAAAAGGAATVVQTDLNRKFLNIAKDSCSLNGFPIRKQDFVAKDFFPAIAHFKSTKQTFDFVIIDPPFFSSTPRGKVDQEHESERLINKVRPLINDGGILIAINNAVFLSGIDYMKTLEKLCRDGYLSIRELIAVPEEFIGLHRIGIPIQNPAPFNHSTKIAILNVRRKQ